jgi:RimJ/RimL family protein N-acetyltransferase
MGRFVHFNWFWLDRALADPEIRFLLIRGGPRGGITGCLAYGPHEVVDLDPPSRMPEVGEIYHLVIDRKYTGQGQGTRAITAAIGRLRGLDPTLKAVRVAHHADNKVAANLYAQLGFVKVGDKIDRETGIIDRLLELRFVRARLSSPVLSTRPSVGFRRGACVGPAPRTSRHTSTRRR